MRRNPSLSAFAFAANTIFGIVAANAVISPSAAASLLTPEEINAAPLDAIPGRYELLPATVDLLTTSSTTVGAVAASSDVTQVSRSVTPSPSIARLQILLDRAGASPGVIDGLDGDNVRSAIAAFEAMRGLPVDGKIGPQVIGAIEVAEQVIGSYVITADDLSTVVDPIPKDYAKMAELAYLGYTRASEALAEQFHMDEDF